MKILVTGADSFVGSYLIPQLIEKHYQLLLIGGNSNALKKKYNHVIVISHLEISQEYLRNQIVEFKPDVVVHLAAYSTPTDEYSDLNKLFEANILFLGKILDALKNTPTKLFINTGSFAEYFEGGDLLDPAYLYTATKNAARFIIQYYASAYNYKYCTVCPYSLYGGIDTRKKVMDYLYESLNAKSPVDTTSGEQVLDFIHINDLVDLYLSIIDNIEQVPDKTTFHAGTGIGHTIKDVINYMEQATGKTANINWGGRDYRRRDIMYSIADNSFQKKLFGWNPKIKFEKGIKMYLEANKKK